LVNFDPSIGSEIRKTRPALIIQNNVGNQYSPVTIVAAVTSQFDTHLYPTEVFLSSQESGLDKDSVILLNHLHTFDKMRLIKKLGRVSTETLARVDSAILASLGVT